MTEAEDFEFEVPKPNVCRLIKAERDENNMQTKENVNVQVAQMPYEHSE